MKIKTFSLKFELRSLLTKRLEISRHQSMIRKCIFNVFHFTLFEMYYQSFKLSAKIVAKSNFVI